ncbi:hypothetical protein [Pseudogemmobacter sp. W21_MBD1_M6]|uniref:hypothetical protein n=1 Tax=Pseudogemmobacter sp. W21_MBD1_M6 TaxID=3240271 RepID=UPI003F9A6928
MTRYDQRGGHTAKRVIFEELRHDSTVHNLAAGRSGWTCRDVVLVIGALMLAIAVGTVATRAISHSAFDAANPNWSQRYE